MAHYHKYSSYLPLMSSHPFDNTGKTYNLSRIINDTSSNLEAYKAYSPLLLPASVVSYELSFASITAILTHSFITANKFGITPVVHSHNNLISMLVSCPGTRRSPIGGV